MHYILPDYLLYEKYFVIADNSYERLTVLKPHQLNKKIVVYKSVMVNAHGNTDSLQEN